MYLLSASQTFNICDRSFNRNFHRPPPLIQLRPPNDNFIANYDWVRDTFQNTPEELSNAEEEILRLILRQMVKTKCNLVIKHS